MCNEAILNLSTHNKVLNCLPHIPKTFNEFMVWTPVWKWFFILLPTIVSQKDLNLEIVILEYGHDLFSDMIVTLNQLGLEERFPNICNNDPINPNNDFFGLGSIRSYNLDWHWIYAKRKKRDAFQAKLWALTSWLHISTIPSYVVSSASERTNNLMQQPMKVK